MLDILIILWTALLGAWTLWLIRESIVFHRQRTAFRIEQYKWLMRAEKVNREQLWNQKNN